MNLTTYSELFKRTESVDFVRIRAVPEKAIRVLHGVLGLMSEWHEWEARAPGTNEIEELGDFLWYTALIADAYGTNLGVLWEELLSIDPWRAANCGLMDFTEAISKLAELSKRAMFYFKEDRDWRIPLLSVLWWIANKTRDTGSFIEHVALANLVKLEARFGTAFSQDAALMRDIKREFQAMEAL